jgi:hypothetical protein
MARFKPFYKDDVVVVDNGTIDPKGLVGVNKSEFVKMFQGQFKRTDINDVWDLVSKHKPKK